MVHNKFSPPDAYLIPVTYSFLEAVKLRVRQPDGTEVLMGYGIGDKVQVMEPNIQYLTAYGRDDIRKEIPLADGSVILEFRPDLRAVQEKSYGS